MTRLENRKEPKMSRTITATLPKNHLVEDLIVQLLDVHILLVSAGHQRPSVGSRNWLSLEN